jgi:hypothetical protein
MKECPQAFDIRTMTAEEKRELIPEFLALADVSGDAESDRIPEEVEEKGFQDGSW